jgi:LacI family transcriptional regulator
VSEKRQSVTLKDVAKLAGVSLTTVSRVMNENEQVSEQTKTHVLRCMANLGYQPNAMAKALVTRGRTKQLAIVVEDIRHPFFADCAAAFNSGAEQWGYNTQFVETRVNPLVRILQQLRSRQLEGIAIMRPFQLVSNSQLKREIEHIQRAGIAVCAAWEDRPDLRDFTSTGYSVVGFDLAKCMRMTINHLVELNHQHIAYIAPDYGSNPLNTIRYTTYLEEMNAHKLKPGPALTPPVYNTADHYKAGYQAAQEVAQQHSEVTAIAAYNDLMALGVLSGLQAAGLRVPYDVSVTGVDGLTASQYATPSLTTVYIDREEIGRLCLKAIVDQLEEGSSSSHLVSAHLVRGGSTAENHQGGK